MKAEDLLNVTKEDVLKESDTVYYTVENFWWTHKASQLKESVTDKLLSPYGHTISTVSTTKFFEDAEKNPGFYGKHGITALMMAHADNNRLINSNHDYPDWNAINQLIDRKLEDANRKLDMQGSDTYLDEKSEVVRDFHIEKFTAVVKRANKRLLVVVFTKEWHDKLYLVLEVIYHGRVIFRHLVSTSSLHPGIRSRELTIEAREQLAIIGIRHLKDLFTNETEE